MSRSGVTYSEVANAARELEGRGINPTVDGIRELLRTGSRSTLGPLLKKWKSEQEEGSAGHIQSGLPQELSSLVKGLYERLQREANIKIEEIEQSAKNEIEYIQSKLDQTVVRNTNLENEIQNLKHKLLDALSLSEQYYKDLEAEQKKSEILLTKSQELETRSEDRAQQILVLEKQLNHTQINLEHFRETTLTQKIDEQKKTEQYNTLLNDHQNNQKKLDELQQLFNEMEKKFLLLEEKMNTSEKFYNIMENRTQELLQEKTIIMKENDELKRKLKMQNLFDYPEQ